MILELLKTPTNNAEIIPRYDSGKLKALRESQRNTKADGKGILKNTDKSADKSVFKCFLLDYIISWLSIVMV